MSRMTVGFIGLGTMGLPMAANLQRRGHPLVVHNRTRARAESLLAAGASWGASPAEVAAVSDVVITMLSEPGVIEDAALGRDGLLHRGRAGTTWINASTVNPSFARDMDGRSRSRGVRYLDAPVAGSREPAERAELVFFVGGDAATLEGCRTVLEVMGRRIIHVGAAGQGSALKLVNNVMSALGLAAFAEAAALGQAQGITAHAIFEALLGGPNLPPFLGAKRDKIEHADFESDFAMRWMQKDLHLASVTAFETGTAMPVTSAAKELYRLAMQAGYADRDFSALCAFMTDKRD